MLIWLLASNTVAVTPLMKVSLLRLPAASLNLLLATPTLAVPVALTAGVKVAV